MKGMVIQPRDGKHLEMGGNNYWFQLENENWTIFTANAVGAMSPPLHYHEHTDEIVVVTKGEFAFQLDGQITRVSEGGIVVIPKGVKHSFLALDDECEAIGIFTPGGIQGYFEEIKSTIAANGGTPPTPQQVAVLQENYDFIVVGPPMTKDSI